MRTTTSVAAGLAVVGALLALPATSATAERADRPSPCDGSVPFVSGQDGYATFRIPAVVQAPDGALVTYAEGRVSESDTGNIDVVSKRSDDGGCTWSALRVVSDFGADTVGNPTPVLDPTTGRLVLLTVRNGGSITEAEILRGEATPETTRRVYVQTSADDGLTYTEPREITSSAKQETWRWYATAPGHAIALTRGRHAGRLVVPANHSSAPPAGSADTGEEDKYYGGHSLYSDDHGATWQIGFVDDTYDGYLNSNETTAAQLPDGRVYFNTRDQNGASPGTRGDGYSTDGGESLVDGYQVQATLDGPVVQGSLLQLAGRRAPLLYSGPRHPDARAVMSIRVSEDAGATWQTATDVSGVPAAYSDLVQLDRHTIGIYYETGATGTYERIEFRRLDLRDILR